MKILLTLLLAVPMFAYAGFGGGRSSSFSSSRSSSFSSRSYSSPSRSSTSSFGGSRSTTNAPIVRNTTTSPSTSVTHVTEVHNYGGGGYGGGSGMGFWHGYFLSSMLNHPTYVQPMVVQQGVPVQGVAGQVMEPVVVNSGPSFGTIFCWVFGILCVIGIVFWMVA